jgi:hypothetical protein
MTRASTDKKTWTHVKNFYQAGFPIPTESYIRVRNRGAARAEVQFRSVVDSTKTLQDFGCVDSRFYAYAEVWIRSLDGHMVTVDCQWGKCSEGIVNDSADDISIPLGCFTDDDIDPRLAELLQSLKEIYKEILTLSRHQVEGDVANQVSL